MGREPDPPAVPVSGRARRGASQLYAAAVSVLLVAGVAEGVNDSIALPSVGRAALAGACLAMAIVLARPSLKIAIGLLSGVGVLVGFVTDLDGAEFVQALGTWTDIVVLLAFVPIVAAVLVERQYIQVVVAAAARVGTMVTQLTVILASHLVGSVALLAVVPVLGDFLGLKNQRPENRRHYARLILRGFAPCITWSPSTGGMGVILLALGLRWTEIAPVLLIVGACGFLLSAGWAFVSQRRRGDAPMLESEHFATSDTDDHVIDRARAAELLIFLAGSFGLILVLEVLQFATTVIVVPVAMLFMTMVVLSLAEGPSRALALLQEHVRFRLPRGAGEATFLLAAGFAGTVLASTGISEAVVGEVLLVTRSIGVPVQAVLSLLVVAVTLIGIPPLVGVALISGAVPVALTGLSPALYASLLVVGSSTSLLIAPFTPTMLMVTDYAGTGVLRSGVQDNSIFAPVYLVSMVTIAVIAERLLN